MEIVKAHIDEIKAYEKNAKEHPREQIEQIKKSILEYGNNDPIAVDENNVIIEGHGRYIALRELGYDTVEIIRLEHMTEEQKKAYRLVHNKLTMNSDFDFDLLEKELAELTAFDVDMSLFGFDESIFDIFFDEAPNEIQLPREEVGTAIKRKSLKFGSVTIYMSDEEAARFENLYDLFMEQNGNAFGFVNELLDYGDKNYAS